MKATKILRRDLEAGRAIVAPGVYDGLSARLVEQAGFKAAYASGGAIARSTGVPDLGLLSMSEIARRLETIVEVVSIPVIADADTGYGNALNAQHAAKAFERAGVAGLHIEDQVFPKRCGHYDDKVIISSREMQQKIRAVRDAISDEDFMVIGRTDALAVEGFDSAVERAHAYMDAGADMIFVEAPTSIEEIEKLAELLPYLKLINMFHGGKTPLMSASQLAELGYNLIIIPNDTQRAAIFAMMRVLDAIDTEGHSGSLREQMVSFQDREKVVRTADYLELDRRYAV